MEELDALYAALKGLENTDTETLIQSLNEVIEAAIGLAPRLIHLNTWLESRGLPPDWTGPLDAWGWVMLVEQGEALTVKGMAIFPEYDLSDERHLRLESVRPPVGGRRHLHRWDRATPDQRAEALRIEAARSNG